MSLLLLLSVAAFSDSVYSTPWLRELVAVASIANQRVPAALGGYRATAESELAFVLREPSGTERVVQAEQTESRVSWQRDGQYEQRILAYRARAIGPNISALTYLRQPWTVPVLYGNQLRLFFGSDSSRRRREPLHAVHPFAADRDEFYRFSGGDTVTVVQTASRRIPIARILVHPRDSAARRTLVFDGEIDIDAERGEIVRMRGRFVVLEPPPGLVKRLRRASVESIAAVELVNAEVAGRFWLPAYQRIEAQAVFSVGADNRSIFRILTRFRNYDITANPDSALGPAIAGAVEIPRKRGQLVIEAGAERADATWSGEPGAQSQHVHSDDFADVAPDSWRPRGAPVFVWRPRRTREILRYNRIEGAFTGVGAQVRMRDAAPDAWIAGSIGWAWSEETARGMASAGVRRGPWRLELGGGRELDNTNDFRPVSDPGATFSALFFSVDDYDYVDRRFAEIRVGRAIGRAGSTVITVGGGAASEWPVARHAEHGPLGGEDFRENRGITGGRFGFGSVRVERSPEVSGEYLGGGIGWTIDGELAAGELDWTRVEASVRWRRDIRALTIVGRLDGGIVTAPHDMPPQRLFELGGTGGLPGYDYKEFAGDRAFLARTLAMHGLGILEAPMRVGRFVLPGLAPAVAIGFDAGLADVSSMKVARAVDLLGARRNEAGDLIPVARPTDGVRGTVAIGLRFFGGSVGVAMARPVDHGEGWRLTFGIGQL